MFQNNGFQTFHLIENILYIVSSSLFPKLIKDACNGLSHGTQQMRQILCGALHPRLGGVNTTLMLVINPIEYSYIFTV